MAEVARPNGSSPISAGAWVGTPASPARRGPSRNFRPTGAHETVANDVAVAYYPRPSGAKLEADRRRRCPPGRGGSRCCQEVGKGWGHREGEGAPGPRLSWPRRTESSTPPKRPSASPSRALELGHRLERERADRGHRIARAAGIRPHPAGLSERGPLCAGGSCRSRRCPSSPLS